MHTIGCASKVIYTLFCYFNFTAAKFGLLDVLHTEVTAAVGVDLGFVPGGGFIIRAVGVGCSWEKGKTKGHYCEDYKNNSYEMYIHVHCVRGGACGYAFPVCVKLNAVYLCVYVFFMKICLLIGVESTYLTLKADDCT